MGVILTTYKSWMILQVGAHLERFIPCCSRVNLPAFHLRAVWVLKSSKKTSRKLVVKNGDFHPMVGRIRKKSPTKQTNNQNFTSRCNKTGRGFSCRLVFGELGKIFEPPNGFLYVFWGENKPKNSLKPGNSKILKG